MSTRRGLWDGSPAFLLYHSSGVLYSLIMAMASLLGKTTPTVPSLSGRFLMISYRPQKLLIILVNAG